MSNVEHNHVFGFPFGPLFLALGTALAAVPLAAAFSIAKLTIGDETLSVEHTLGPLTYGHRSIPRHDNAYVRIRQRGLLGASLEIISDGHVLLAINGIHRTTQVNPSDLLQIAGWISDKLYR